MRFYTTVYKFKSVLFSALIQNVEKKLSLFVGLTYQDEELETWQIINIFMSRFQLMTIESEQ